jgi:hypothetical protein
MAISDSEPFRCHLLPGWLSVLLFEDGLRWLVEQTLCCKQKKTFLQNPALSLLSKKATKKNPTPPTSALNTTSLELQSSILKAASTTLVKNMGDLKATSSVLENKPSGLEKKP